MSKLFKEFLEKQALLQKLENDVARLRDDDRLKADMAFKDALDDIIQEHGRSAKEAVAILDPESTLRDESTFEKAGKKRRLKTYKNPHTNETVETRGGNNKVISEWKKEYGEEEVKNWIVKIEET